MVRRPLIVGEVARADDHTAVRVPVLCSARDECEVKAAFRVVVDSVTIAIGPVRVDQLGWFDPLLLASRRAPHSFKGAGIGWYSTRQPGVSDTPVGGIERCRRRR